MMHLKECAVDHKFNKVEILVRGGLVDFELYEADVWILAEGDLAWYGPSFGEPPEVVGQVEVKLTDGSPAKLQTRIRIRDEEADEEEEAEDWSDPVDFQRRAAEVDTKSAGMFVFGGAS